MSILIHVGMSGAGKTYALRREVYRMVSEGRRVLVIDRMSEWDAVPPEVSEKGVAGIQGDAKVEDLSDAVRSNALTIWRPGFDTGKATEAACEVACVTPGPTAVCVPEAHMAWPKTFSGEADEHYRAQVITAWRHFDVDLLADTQRFALLNTNLCELARGVRLFAMSGHNDLARARAYGGKELEEAVIACAGKLDEGEPGWHVFVRSRRAPPYQVIRYGE